MLGVAGHGLLLFSDPIDVAFPLLALAGSLLSGCFVALAVLSWGVRCSEGRAQHVLVDVAVSYMASQAVLVACFAFGLPQGVLMLACPVACALGAWRFGARARADADDSRALGLADVEVGMGADGSRGLPVPWRMVGPALFLVYFCVIFVRLLVSSFTGDATASSKVLAGAIGCAVYLFVLAVFARQGDVEAKMVVQFVLIVVLYLGALVAMLLLGGHEHAAVRRVLIAIEHCVEVFVWMALVRGSCAREADPVCLSGFYLLSVVLLPWVLSFDVFYLAGLDAVVSGSDLLVSAVTVASFVTAFAVIAFLFAAYLKTGFATGPAAESFG